MAVLKVKIAGREVTFQSEDDFARALSALERVDDAPEKNGKPSRPAAPARAYNPLQGTHDFLYELVNHEGGMHSTVVATALKCDPRGIGRRLLEVDAVLKSFGFKRDNVYDNAKRLAEGGRMYFPRSDAGAAFEAVKRKLASG